MNGSAGLPFRYTSGYACDGGVGRQMAWGGWFSRRLSLSVVLFKQDGGGMAFFIAGALLAAIVIGEKMDALVIFCGKFCPCMLYTDLPFSGGGGGFSYWFNHGQPLTRPDIGF